MRTYLTIKNYRCFVRPATIQVAKGFTAFVGVNNAGKSTIMRFLLETRNLFEQITPAHGNFHQSLRDFSGGVQLRHVADSDEIFSNLNREGIQIYVDFVYEQGEVDPPAKVRPTRVAFLLERDLRWRTEIHLESGKLTFNANIDFDKGMLRLAGRALADLSALFEITNTFFRTLYIGPFRNIINVGTKTDYLDIAIGEAFIIQFRELKTGASKRASTEISSLTESIKVIFGFDSLDIAPSSDNTSLHITINGKPYKQHELGSGIAQFIVVLANASIRRPELILIDEPELNLHPSLQLAFLTTLASYTKEGVWFSTHSLGLARSSAERLYSVIREGDGDSIIRPFEGTPRLAELLGELSFSSHKELGFEKLLLVEGPTEVKVIQFFLRAMGKDQQYVLLPMHGHLPQIEEIEEILRITTDVAVLIDSERSGSADPLEIKRREFLTLCDTKGIKAHALDWRATENYFPDFVVKSVFGERYRGLTPYERLRDVQPNWSKSQNWKLAVATPLDQLRATDLGRFLESL